jgi:hypothetical protein
LVFAGAAVFGLAACDVLLGLGNYRDGDDAATDAPAEAQVEAGMDGAVDAPVDAHPDAHAGTDADADADAAVGENEAGIDGPTLLQRWAQWPMPNPDASIGGDSSVLLPNPMSYDAGDEGGLVVVDGGGLVVLDEVTGLAWERDGSTNLMSYKDAATRCARIQMRLPTRIELVSLIDFTQTPTIAGAMFPGTQSNVYWTSSTYPVEAGAQPWYVNFADGTVNHYPVQTNCYVRCVSGGPP